jgi:hypothetical protein
MAAPMAEWEGASNLGIRKQPKVTDGTNLGGAERLAPVPLRWWAANKRLLPTVPGATRPSRRQSRMALGRRASSRPGRQIVLGRSPAWCYRFAIFPGQLSPASSEVVWTSKKHARSCWPL